MRGIMLGIAASLMWAGAAHGQYVNVRTQRIGPQVITDVELVKPPLLFQGKTAELLKPPLTMQGKEGEPVKPPQPVPAKMEAVGGAYAIASVLNARNWRCGGTLFDDDEGRRWRLVSGLPVKDAPRYLSGWRMVPVEGQTTFFTTSGRAFARQ